MKLSIIDPPPIGKATVNSLEKCLYVTPLYLKNWILLEFHTWCVYTSSDWQERALTNIFSNILEAMKKSKKSDRHGFF